MPTQKERILALLRAYGDEGVCTVQLTYEMNPRIMRPQSRISDLRQDGWEIETKLCWKHEGRDSHVRYTLLSYLLTPKPTKLERAQQAEQLHDEKLDFERCFLCGADRRRR